jgi:hypothetical protein
MPKATKKNWKRKGIELWDIGHLYPESTRQEILNALPSRPTNPDETLTRAVNIAAILNGELYYANRPTEAEMLRRVEDISNSLDRLRGEIAEVDHDTRTKLQEVASRDPVNRQTEPDPSTFDQSFYGTLRVRLCFESMESLGRWLETVKNELKPKSGRKAETYIRNAVEAIITLWCDEAIGQGKGPTFGEADALAHVILDPVLPPGKSLESVIKSLLYK